ncbi:hypothetical protein [Actinomadura montaniterrae]|uniref:Uncharacterized protein n=1 Tax=Actinomadura montaniterrae TaxID=1803903 RepID=A0A6L3VX79_9ACTN|nr:hypothetical protein [Actinomadura montaniterrae]KAB2384731.1 hypothetical protein F9B16_09800 [Actinomadura montaniterrae]
MDTIPLFGEPEPAEPPKPKKTPGTSNAKPVWSRYRPATPRKCDDCMAVLAETKGAGPHSRTAVWKRKTGRAFLLLCYPHAQQRREADGLPKLKKEISA